MIKFKKLMVCIGLITSLSLQSRFDVLKNVGKTILGACLTTGVLCKGVSAPLDQFSVAFHEAGHAVVAENLSKESVTDVYVTRCGSTNYRGICRIINCSNSINPKNHIIIDLAGYAQDLQDVTYRHRMLHFMELELGFSLSYVGQATRMQLEDMYHGDSYHNDLKSALRTAYEIAFEEFSLNHDDYEGLDLSIKKQIDDRVQDLLVECLDEAKKIVKAQQKEIHAVANVLCHKNGLKFLFGDDVREIMQDTTIVNPSKTALHEKELDEYKKYYGENSFISSDVRKAIIEMDRKCY